MEVIYEGTIDKEVMVPEKLRVTKQSQKTTHKIIAEDEFGQTNMLLPKDLILKCRRV